MKDAPKRSAALLSVITTLVIALIFCAPAFAQITVTNATFPSAGDTLKMAVNNSPSVINLIFTPPGGPQTWDLSGLNVDATQNFIYRAASEGSVSGQVSGAELVTLPPSPHAEEYYNVTTTRFELQGYYGIAPYDLVSNELFHYKPPLTERQASLNFFDTYASSSGILENFLPSAFTPALVAALPATFDSLRYRVAFSQIDAVDAYGSMSIPGGSYNVLREKRTRYTETRLDGKHPVLGWLDITNDAILAGFHGLGVDTTIFFYFYNDVAKEPIARVTLNSAQNAATQTLFKYNAPTTTAPSLTINNVTLNEGNAGTTSFDFTVSLDQPAPAGGVTFDIATADGTTNPATAPSDYTAKELFNQNIPEGSSTYTFSVLINGDTEVEPNETFFVNVLNVINASTGDAQGLGTITNDDVSCAAYTDNRAYVNALATGANNGTSWADAYTDLQSALANTCPGITEIWVAAGLYKPTTGTDRTISFVMKNGVAIYGGFPNTGNPTMANRDWATHVTTLSGDIGTTSNNTDNSYHVIFNNFTSGTPLTSSAVLDGFTVTGGNANAVAPHSNGGGMYNVYASPTVANCTFTLNTVVRSNATSTESAGGGMYNSNSSPSVTNCTFSNNEARAINTAGHSYGAGMYNASGSPTLSNCVFASNTTPNDDEDTFGGGVCNVNTTVIINGCSFTSNQAVFGGGMYNDNSTITVTNCTFTGNQISTYPGGVNGGAMNNKNSSGSVSDCTFLSNAGVGAMSLEVYSGNPVIAVTNCTFSGNNYGIANQSATPTVTNCLFTANTYGGIVNWTASSSAPTIINCTFSENPGSGLGSISNYGSASPVLTNCIIWGSGNSVYVSGGSVAPTITYSIVKQTSGVFPGTGNLNDDPLFVSASDFHLQTGSPAIDFGTNTGAPSTDIEGNPRPLTVANPADMGAYENTPAIPVILTAEGPAAPVFNGASIAVTIKVAQFTNLGTLQFSVNWDETELQLVDNTPLTIDDDAPLLGTPAPNQLTYTWFDSDINYGVTLPDGTTILTLNFAVLAAAPRSGINVDITDTPTTVEASDNNFAAVPVTVNNLVNFDVIAPTVKPFVFVANKVTLKGTKQSTSTGDVHSNGLLTVEKGKPSTYNSNLTAVGKISIGKYNTINGNVKSQTSVSNSGTITGTKSVGAVNTEALPSLSFTAGGANKTVPSGGSLTLAPGSYGIVTMNNNSTLKLTSGEYFMNELRYSSSIDNGTIEIDLSSGNPVTINVVSNLQLGHDAAIRLLPNGESDSKLVTFNTKQTTSANWGREAYLLGSFNAPNAVVTLVKNTQLRGTICAKEILVSNDCLFLHHDAPGSLPGPGNLPKTSGDDEEVSGDQLTVISDYALEQNYPNPFNPSTTITFALPQASEVTLSIFNTSGQLVKQLVAGAMNAGQHAFTWDATNERGERVASGVYLYVIKAGEFTAQKKLVLMK